jgi:hypothetical protein
VNQPVTGLPDWWDLQEHGSDGESTIACGETILELKYQFFPGCPGVPFRMWKEEFEVRVHIRYNQSP